MGKTEGCGPAAFTGHDACPPREDLRAFHSGAASARLAEAVVRHLETGCPTCDAALETLDGTPDEIATILRFHGSRPTRLADRYDVREEIGRGGMGVVSLAFDLKLKREVAVKTLLLPEYLLPVIAERFRQEAEVLAKINHPNVVRLYDFGSADGAAYLVSEFVRGQSLDRLLKARQFSPRESAKIIEKSSRAVHAVHSLGIIHRDLKPANLLITEDTGDVKVTDFGLARGEESAGLTRSGAAIGTPEYMSPEQAEGREGVGVRSDVYSLGATLYQMLANLPPFRGASPVAVFDQVLRTEPTPPSRHQPGVPRDLETICLKCLEKNPARRYETAEALADDLARYLDGEPIKARPLRAAERFVRTIRRHRTVSALAAALAVSLIAGIAYSFVMWRAERTARLALEDTTYYLRIRDADREFREGRNDKAMEALNACAPNLRGWEWNYLRRRCGFGSPFLAAQDGSLATLSFFEDGKTPRVGLLSDDGTLWELRGKQKKVLWQNKARDYLRFNLDWSRMVAVDMSANGKLGRDLRVWDVQRKALLLERHSGDTPVLVAELSPNGDRIAFAQKEPETERDGKFQITVIDVDNPKRSVVMHGVEPAPKGPAAWDSPPIEALRFSTDGSLLACGTRTTAQIFDAQTGSHLHTIPAHVEANPEELHGVNTVEFVGPGNGKILFGGRMDPRVKDRPELMLADLSPPYRRRVIANNYSRYHPLVVSPNGNLAAIPKNLHFLSLVDLNSNVEVGKLRTSGDLAAAAFSPDGRKILTGDRDGEVLIHDIESSEVGEFITYRGPKPRVFGIAPTRDGETVLFTTIGDEKSEHGVYLRAWSRSQRKFTHQVLLDPAGTQNSGSISLSEDDKLAALGMYTGELIVADWRREKVVANEKVSPINVTSVKFLANGDIVAASPQKTATEKGRLVRWPAGFKIAPVVLRDDLKYFEGLSIHPQSDTVAIPIGKDVRFVRLSDGASMGALEMDGNVETVVWHPNGKSLLMAMVSPRELRLIEDWRTGRVLWRVRDPFQTSVRSVQFFDEGKRVFAAPCDRTAKIWDAQTGQELLTLHGHTAAINRGTVLESGLAFTSSFDGTIRVWDGREMPAHR